jgi:DNA-binding transcriptional MerR regulator
MAKKLRRGADIVLTPKSANLTLRTFAPTVTISGLAKALAPIAPDEAATVQALRHWTREGMLSPSQHLHSGPGVHREYILDVAIYEAAILHLFNDMGLPISGSRILAEALEQVRREVAKRRAGKGKKKARLIITGAGGADCGGGMRAGGESPRRRGDDQYRSRKAIRTGRARRVT